MHNGLNEPEEFQPSAHHVDKASGKIGEQADPTHSGTGANGRHAFSQLIGKQDVRKIDAGHCSKLVVAPGSRIDVEEFVFAIARIKFEFDFHETVVIHSAQESLSQFLEDGELNRFNKRAGASELRRMLAPVARHHGCHTGSFSEECEISKDLLAPAGNEILNHDFAGWKQSFSLPETSHQFFSGVRTPRFYFGCVYEMFLDSGL